MLNIGSIPIALCTALVICGVPSAFAQTLQSVEFIIETGDDDLRTTSSSQAVLTFPDQSKQTCALKKYNADTWDNNSSHSVPCHLKKSRTLKELRHTRILIEMFGGHDQFQTDDNWNLQRITILGYRAGAGEKKWCIFRAGGTPLVRFKADSRDMMVTNFPNGC